MAQGNANCHGAVGLLLQDPRGGVTQEGLECSKGGEQLSRRQRTGRWYFLDHDQRFKTLIQTFFQEFLLLFFKEWVDLLEAGAVEWLDKEIFLDPPEGQRRTLDLVGKVPTRKEVVGQRPGEPDQWLALVRIEIESPDRVVPLRSRMFDAYVHLRRQHGLPVLPIGLFLRVGLDGIGIDVYEERFWKFQPLRFQYFNVGLPALDAVEYVHGDNWLGVALAALMKIPKDRAAWLGAEALRRIQEAPLNDQQRFLLGEVCRRICRSTKRKNVSSSG
jgi:hypothetical protein